VKTLRVTASDNRYTLREALRRHLGKRVLFVLPWDADEGLKLPLDFEVLMRAARRGDQEVAWVVEDPDRRPLVREAGFPVFANVKEAEAYVTEHEGLPPLKPPPEPRPPRVPWWAEEPQPKSLPHPRRRPVWLLPLELAVLVVVLFLVGTVGFLVTPSAQVHLAPVGATYEIIVPIHVDPEMETVDLETRTIPSRRVGDEFEGYAEVATTGRSLSFSGKATGWVAFTNQLGQDYNVPAGTIVRTSAGSYPVRYQTTADVTVPPFGQAQAPVEALEEGPRANVDAYQINFVEGVVGFALRVTNPAPITGAQSEEVLTVSEEDRERVWELAAEQAMGEAYNGLQSEAYLEPGELLPRQPMVIQAVPKTAYTHLVGEQSDTLGLSLRLLVTGRTVDATDVRAVAYRELASHLPEGYTLTDARFEYGQAAEEDVGPGIFTLYVTAHGYASAEIDRGAAWEMIRGQPVEEAEAALAEAFPLARPPEVEVSPSWFPRVPHLPLRVDIDVVAGTW
jgi:hypothetical protein